MRRLDSRTETLTRGIACAAALLLVLVALPAPAQEGAVAEGEAARDEILSRAMAVAETDGRAAALELLEGAKAERGTLSAPAEALLGALLLADGRAAEAYDVLEPISRRDEAPPAVLYNTWQAAARTGRGGERIDLLERAVAIDPVSPAGRQLGLLHGAQGRYDEAYLLLAPWARAHPEDLEARLAAAAAALQLERVPAAEEMLSDLPQDDPRVRLLWGKALFLRGDPYGSLATLKAMGDGEDLPSNIDRDRRQAMANAYVAIGQAEEAVRLLEGHSGEDRGLILLLAHAQAQSGNVGDALATIRPLAEAVMRDPDAYSAELASGALFEFGRQLIATGAAEEAVRPLELATELDPHTEGIWQSLGQALALTGRREEAREALERFDELAQNAVPSTVQQSSLERGADDPTARRLREALVLMGQGRGVEALDVVRSERRIAPEDPRVPTVEAQILHDLGLDEEAYEAIDAAIEIDPGFADAYYQRAVVLMSEERLEEAERDYRRALELAPSHTPAMNDLAVLLMVQGRNEEARRLLEQVLEINSDDKVAAENLAALDG